jgi:aldose 1-epimerase
LPTDELIEIACGDRKALVDRHGACLVQVSAAGADLLVSPSDESYPRKGADGQLLLPWPGRISDGAYHFDGAEYQLPIDDPTLHSAIHGLVRSVSWQVNEHRAASVTLGYRLLAQAGYPFTLGIEQSYAFREALLEICTTATNIGSRTAPYGYGAHPNFTVGSPTINDALLYLPASDYFLSDWRLDPKLPAIPVEGSPYDFRSPRPIGVIELDTTYTAFTRDEQGTVAVSLSSSDGALTITCTFEEPIGFVHVYSGDTRNIGRREGLAIEPYTCLPNAFNNGVGLMRLAPGVSVRVRWTISAS